MFRNYFITAFRNFRRNKIYSLINILGLSIGLACGMLIILYVKDELSYDRFHAQGDQLYRIGTKRIKPDGSIEGMGGYTGYFPGPRFAANIPGIKTFVRVQSNQRDIKTGTEVRSQPVHLVDSNFFSVFSFPLLSGQPATALHDPYSVVISEEVALKEFGTTDVLGKTIQITDDENQFKPYQVTGVAKKCPQNSSLKFSLLLPMRVSKETEAQNMNWLNFFLNTFVVLQPGANPQQVEAKMKQVYAADARESIRIAAEQYGDNATTLYNLQPFTDIHLSADYKADNGLTDASNPTYSYILSGIALFILLIACINFVNLTVARSLKRAKEIGIRKVIGGDRRQLIWQFLGESFFLCLLAFALAILLVQGALPVFNELSNKALALSYLLDAKLVTGYIALFLVTGLLAGFYPSLVLSGYSPVKTLYSRFTLAGKNYLQKSLVVLQFTLASFLIIATITIYTQFDYLTHKELGYDDNHLVVANLPMFGITHSAGEVVKEKLLQSPGIQAVACKNGGGWATVARVNGEQQLQFAYETVDENYLPLLWIPLVKGRNFSKDFPSDSTHSVIVNEAFVKKAGWKDPIGQVVNFWYNEGEKYTVVGVVKDYHYESLTHEIGPQLFTMKPGNSYGKVFIKLRPGSETASLRHIEKTLKTLYPLSPYVYIFKDQENAQQYEAVAKWKKIMLLGAVLTIFISCIGLFGLSVLAAEKRVKEIGIRKVLGATVGHVVGILSRDFLKLVTLALLIAVPLAWLTANAWLRNYPYRIGLSWWMFALAGGLVVLIALVTISFNAVKAAIANPVRSLRSE